MPPHQNIRSLLNWLAEQGRKIHKESQIERNQAIDHRFHVTNARVNHDSNAKIRGAVTRYSVALQTLLVSAVLASAGCSVTSELVLDDESNSPDAVAAVDLPKTRHVPPPVPVQRVSIEEPGIPIFVTNKSHKPDTRSYSLVHDTVWDRIRKNPSISFDPNHPRIAAERERYLNEPRYLNMVTQRAEPFLHYILDTLAQERLPLELALLPIIESAYIVDAVSKSGASGIWQFIPATGKTYGLERNSLYDGRRDIIASTDAAVRYLRKLNEMFQGDWLHALAGYNAGEMNIVRAIDANLSKQKPTDFWNLALRQETSQYVPRFLAVLSIVQMPEYYGIELWPVPDEPNLVTIEIPDRGVSLSRIAADTGADLEHLRKLNAGLLRDVTPGGEPYNLLVPPILANRLRDATLDHYKVAIAPTPEAGTLPATYESTKKTAHKVHRVKAGETLAKLSRMYGVSIATIKSTNGLTSDKLTPDQRLNIPPS